MINEIVFTKRYKRRAKQFIRKHPELLPRYKKTIIQLKENPYHPSLRLHKLKGSLQDYHSVSINMKYRILLDFVIVNDRIILIDIGSHDQMY